MLGRVESKVIDKKDKLKVIISITFILILIALLVWGLRSLSYSDKFSISGIQIIGLEGGPKAKVHDEVINFLAVKKLINVNARGFLPKVKLQNKIYKLNPEISNLHIKFKGNILVITIELRKPEYVWCRIGTEDNCFFVDTTGYIYKDAPNFSRQVYPTFETDYIGGDNPVGRYFHEAKKLQNLAEIYKIATVFNSELNRINIRSPHYVEVDLMRLLDKPVDPALLLLNRFDIENGEFDWLNEAMRSLVLSTRFQNKLLAESGKLAYVDFRFFDRIFYKFIED